MSDQSCKLLRHSMRSEMSPLLQGAVYHSRKFFAVARHNADTVATASTYFTFVSECSGVTRLSGISIVMSQRHLQVHVDVLSDAFKHDSNGSKRRESSARSRACRWNSGLSRMLSPQLYLTCSTSDTAAVIVASSHGKWQVTQGLLRKQKT